MSSSIIKCMLFASIACLGVVISVPLRAQVRGATLSGTVYSAVERPVYVVNQIAVKGGDGGSTSVEQMVAVGNQIRPFDFLALDLPAELGKLPQL